MKKLMILGAGEIQVPIIKKAKEIGLYSIVVDINPQAPGFLWADEKLTISTIDLESIFKEAKKKKIDGILTTSDYPVNIVANVCKRLNLPGMSTEVAKICTNKFYQREFLSKFDFHVPYFKLLKSEADIEDLHDFPLIIKPVDSSASRGVKKVNNEEELRNQYPITSSYSKSGYVIVEGIINGREFSVETFTQNNITNVIAITEKFIENENFGCFVEDCHIIPANLFENEETNIKTTVIKALRMLRINNCPSHTEVKLNDSGVYIIEIACRLGGDFITSDLVPLATGVDMLHNLIKVSLGESIDLRITKNKVAAIQFFNNRNYDRCKEFIKSNSSKIILSEIKQFHSRTIENSSDRMGYVILSTDNRSEMDDLLTNLYRNV